MISNRSLAKFIEFNHLNIKDCSTSNLLAVDFQSRPGSQGLSCDKTAFETPSSMPSQNKIRMSPRIEAKDMKSSRTEKLLLSIHTAPRLQGLVAKCLAECQEAVDSVLMHSSCMNPESFLRVFAIAAIGQTPQAARSSGCQHIAGMPYICDNAMTSSKALPITGTWGLLEAISKAQLPSAKKFAA